MFKLLAGRTVHEAPTVNEQLLAAMTEPAPRLASVVPGAPALVAGIVDRALEFNKKDRWPDARRMQQAVHTAYDELTGRAPSGAYQSPKGDSSEAIALAPTIAVENRPSLGSAPTKVFRRKGRVWRWLFSAICLAAAIYLYLKHGKRLEGWVTATTKDSFPGVATSSLPARRDPPPEPPRPASALAPAKERTRSDPHSKPAPSR
jgi:hypothetical protein